MSGDEAGVTHGSGGIGRLRSTLGDRTPDFDHPVGLGLGFVLVGVLVSIGRQTVGYAYDLVFAAGGYDGSDGFLPGVADEFGLATYTLVLLAPFLGAAVSLLWPERGARAGRRAAVAATTGAVVLGGSLRVTAAVVDPGSVGEDPLVRVVSLLGTALVVGLGVLLGRWLASRILPAPGRRAQRGGTPPTNAGESDPVGGRSAGPGRRRWSDPTRQDSGSRGDVPDRAAGTDDDPGGRAGTAGLATVIAPFALGVCVLAAAVAGGIDVFGSNAIEITMRADSSGSAFGVLSADWFYVDWLQAYFDPEIPAIAVGIVAGLVWRRRNWWKAAAGAGLPVFGVPVGVFFGIQLAGVDVESSGSFSLAEAIGPVAAGLDALEVAVLAGVVASIVASTKAWSAVDGRAIVRRFDRLTPLRTMALFCGVFALGAIAVTAEAAVTRFGDEVSVSILVDGIVSALFRPRVVGISLAPVAGVVSVLVADRREGVGWIGLRAAVGATAGYVVVAGTALVVETLAGLNAVHDLAAFRDVTNPVLYELGQDATPLPGIALVAGVTAAATAWAVRTRRGSTPRDPGAADADPETA